MVFDLVLLAAGEGSRLRPFGPKPLVSFLGERMVDFPILRFLSFMEKRKESFFISVIVGNQAEAVKEHLLERFSAYASHFRFIVQEERKGTGHALFCYETQIAAYPQSQQGDILFVASSDTPLLESFHYEEMMKHKSMAIAATFEARDSSGLGRIVRKKTSFSIVEEKEASLEEQKIREVNAGFYLFHRSYLQEHISVVMKKKNKSKEFYLTDIFQGGSSEMALNFKEDNSFFGVNDLSQLQEAEDLARKRKLFSLMKNGVRLMDLNSISIDEQVKVSPGVVIHPQVSLQGKTVIGEGVVLGQGSIVKNSHLKEKVNILPYCVLEEVTIEQEASIGPFARLRPGTFIGEKGRIGNFVEVKKSHLAKEVKVSHLSYVGDATIGERTNIGCGFVTCNYDGVKKHQTIIGKDCFIGSDSQMIAPIEIGDNSYVASGSTVNRSVGEESFVIARARQETKVGLAKKFKKRKDGL